MTGSGYRSAQGETTKCVVEASEYPRSLLNGMAWETNESDQTRQGSMFPAEECENTHSAWASSFTYAPYRQGYSAPPTGTKVGNRNTGT